MPKRGEDTFGEEDIAAVKKCEAMKADMPADDKAEINRLAKTAGGQEMIDEKYPDYARCVEEASAANAKRQGQQTMNIVMPFIYLLIFGSVLGLGYFLVHRRYKKK
jgi:Na+/H+-translocating membrane pyrophosphatase